MFRYTNSISTPTRHKRPKRSKTPAVAVLAVIGVFCCSTFANGAHDLSDLKQFNKLRELRQYKEQRAGLCHELDLEIARILATRFHRDSYEMPDYLAGMIEAWEGYCKGRKFDD